MHGRKIVDGQLAHNSLNETIVRCSNIPGQISALHSIARQPNKLGPGTPTMDRYGQFQREKRQVQQQNHSKPVRLQLNFAHHSAHSPA